MSNDLELLEQIADLQYRLAEVTDQRDYALGQCEMRESRLHNAEEAFKESDAACADLEEEKKRLLYRLGAVRALTDLWKDDALTSNDAMGEIRTAVVVERQRLKCSCGTRNGIHIAHCDAITSMIPDFGK